MVFRRVTNGRLTVKSGAGRCEGGFLSVLNEGFQAGLIGEQAAGNIQAGIASILADLIRRYTAGDGSSVKDETAASMLGSVYYAIDAWTAAHPDGLFDALSREDIREIYRQGVEIVRRCFDETKFLFREIAENRLAVPLAPYNDLLDRDIPEFLKTYDIEFNAHETTCCMDYPLAFDNPRESGIFYIRAYLENLRLETRFCQSIGQKALLKTLRSYALKFGMDIVNTPLNLFEMIFDQLVFTFLTGGDRTDLSITPAAYEQMVRKLSGGRHSEIRLRINKAVNGMIADYQFGDPGLTEYIRRYQQQFTRRMIRALDNGNLRNMVLIRGENIYENKTLFEDGTRMSDEAFTRLTEEILRCDKTEYKIELIKENIRSSQDYMDLLESDCLFENEFAVLFGSLGDTELAVLGKTVFEDGLRDVPPDSVSSQMEYFKRNAHRDWQLHYIDFWEQLGQQRRMNIQTLINSLQLGGTEPPGFPE